MPPRKKSKKVAKPSPKCCGENPHLPGYLLIAFGLLALPLNFGLIPGLEWAKAWPLLLVLFGIAMVVKTVLAKGRF
ncbi:hypothetical protein KKB44_02020 [Candidatus Micrarchaeota archaeon]|nr:hypothetical protein [Candidatus Micrarchaeota archaeon]